MSYLHVHKHTIKFISFKLQKTCLFQIAFIASLPNQNQLPVRVHLLEIDYGVLVHGDQKFVIVLVP